MNDYSVGNMILAGCRSWSTRLINYVFEYKALRWDEMIGEWRRLHHEELQG